jgi:hypothetical protein
MHLAYMVLDVSAMAIVVFVVGFVCKWFCSTAESDPRQEVGEVIFAGSCDELVIKIVGNNEDFEEDSAVPAQEVIADGR